jgi:hypothetical protein
MKASPTWIIKGDLKLCTMLCVDLHLVGMQLSSFI